MTPWEGSGPVPSHPHADLERRMDRIDGSITGLIGIKLFDERDKVNREAHRRIEDLVRALRKDFDDAEKARRDNARSLRNLVLAALFSGVVSIIVSLVVLGVTKP